MTTLSRSEGETVTKRRDVDEAIAELDDVLEFAYDHGYHEHGFPLVNAVRTHVARSDAELQKASAQIKTEQEATLYWEKRARGWEGRASVLGRRIEELDAQLVVTRKQRDEAEAACAQSQARIAAMETALRVLRDSAVIIAIDGHRIRGHDAAALINAALRCVETWPESNPNRAEFLATLTGLRMPESMSEAKAGPVAGVASDTAPVTGALTAERRKMIAARLAALAPGDWTVDGTCVDGEIAIRAFPDEGDEDAEPALIAIVFADDDLCIDGEAAAEFIAHAREDMPDLLAALQHAERERGEAVKDAERWKARLREVVDGWRDTTTDSMEYDDLLDTMDAYLNGRIITQSDGAARAIASGRE